MAIQKANRSEISYEWHREVSLSRNSPEQLIQHLNQRLFRNVYVIPQILENDLNWNLFLCFILGTEVKHL